MINLTINGLEDDVAKRLTEQASNNGRTIEHEARVILRDALRRTTKSKNIVTAMRKHLGPEGGVDIDLPPRT